MPMKLLFGFVFLATTQCQAQNVTSDVIEAALLARLGGFGGCTYIENQSTSRVPYFPQVTFILGQCTLEHGDTASALVAQGEDGTIYPLGSGVGYDFFRRLNTVVGLDSTTAVAFSHMALGLLGETSSYEMPVGSASDIPDDVLDGIALRAVDLVGSRVVRQEEGAPAAYLELYALSEHRLARFNVILFYDTGAIAVTASRVWDLAD